MIDIRNKKISFQHNGVQLLLKNVELSTRSELRLSIHKVIIVERGLSDCDIELDKLDMLLDHCEMLSDSVVNCNSGLFDIRSKIVKLVNPPHLTLSPSDLKRISDLNVDLVKDGMFHFLLHIGDLMKHVEYSESLNVRKPVDITGGKIGLLESVPMPMFNLIKYLEVEIVNINEIDAINYYGNHWSCHERLKEDLIYSLSKTDLTDLRDKTIFINLSRKKNIELSTWRKLDSVNCKREPESVNADLVYDDGSSHLIGAECKWVNDLNLSIEYSLLLKEMENKSDITKEVSEKLIDKIVGKTLTPVYTQEMVDNNHLPEVGMLTAKGVVMLGQDSNDMWVIEEDGMWVHCVLSEIEPCPPVKSDREVLLDGLIVIDNTSNGIQFQKSITVNGEVTISITDSAVFDDE